ncbi:hypothetical protein KIF24_27875 [Micromonospora sp. Llam7]|uniref:hypothetical protein n=1 Tax=Micromonospora tarapacensis TaxID=2835305 RepID=UPI001C831A4A|nr:hypothetical protein [Micromonospora tarapacensis]MBX7269453.1 hypothetical protein [Micromonospora tarapacensis]
MSGTTLAVGGVAGATLIAAVAVGRFRPRRRLRRLSGGAAPAVAPQEGRAGGGRHGLRPVGGLT